MRGRWKGIALGASVIAVVAVAAVLLLSISSPTAAADIVTYCGGEGTAAHYHILLVIEDNGVQEHLPYQPTASADIGYINQPGFTNSQYYCSSGIHALHTHDGSGIIHAEIPAGISLNPPPTLGEFFQIWGEPLSSSSVWSYSGTVSAHVIFQGLTPSSGDFSSNPASIPLSVPRDGQLSNPFPIPQAWIFSGAYGDGSSQGVFGGEIIWLNISSGSNAATTGAVHPVAPALSSGGQPPGSVNKALTANFSRDAPHPEDANGGLDNLQAARAP